MRHAPLAVALCAIGLATALGCGSPDTSAEGFDRALKSAGENLEDAADEAANALEGAAQDFGEVVEEAAKEVEKAVGDSRASKSNAR